MKKGTESKLTLFYADLNKNNNNNKRITINVTNKAQQEITYIRYILVSNLEKGFNFAFEILQ